MKIVMTSPVEHDGKALPMGKAIDLATDVAEALVKAGAAEAAGGKQKAQAAEQVAEADGAQPDPEA